MISFDFRLSIAEKKKKKTLNFNPGPLLVFRPSRIVEYEIHGNLFSIGACLLAPSRERGAPSSPLFAAVRYRQCRWCQWWVMRFCGFCGFCGVRDRDRVFDRRYTDIPKYDSCRFNQQPNRSIRTPVRIAEQGLKHRSCQAAIHICRCMIHASRSRPACIHVSMPISHVPMHVLRRSRINPRTAYRSWYV